MSHRECFRHLVRGVPPRGAAVRRRIPLCLGRRLRGRSSDFLGVIDASPSSPTYGSVVASLPTGVAGTHPHHTEAVLGANGHLLANGFHAGRTWLFDFPHPARRRSSRRSATSAALAIPTRMSGCVTGTSSRRSSTTSRTATPSAPALDAASHMHDAAAPNSEHTTGGLVEMDERGTVIRTAAAAIGHSRPVHLSVLRAADYRPRSRAVDDHRHGRGEQEGDVAMGAVVAAVGPDAARGASRSHPDRAATSSSSPASRCLLPDGKSAYIHTFNCGLYLVRGVDGDRAARDVREGIRRARTAGSRCSPATTGCRRCPTAHALVVARHRRSRASPRGRDAHARRRRSSRTGSRSTARAGGSR